MKTEILTETNVDFRHSTEALNYIADKLTKLQIVKESYRSAVLEREADFPTGIALEQYAVAIPHCEAEHSLKPAVYFIRPNHPVTFQRADDDGTIDVNMIIALVVVDPKAQLVLLRTLFGKLQNKTFVENLLTTADNQLPQLLEQHLNFN